jgi:hypothetical protein
MAKEQPFTITGYVRLPDGSPVAGVRVTAVDRDMRSEQPLGEMTTTEAGYYTIGYTAEQFRQAEIKGADLIVRAYDEAENLRAESDIYFNAGPTVQIDLVFGPLPEPPRRELSELEKLQQVIEPLLEGVEYQALTDDDLEFLSHELGLETGFSSAGDHKRQSILEILGYLRQASLLARETDIPLAAFYGWFRRKLTSQLAALLDQPLSSLREALERASVGRIIPDITEEIPGILERLRALRFKQGRVVSHRFVARLLDDDTGSPLAGHRVEATDLEAEPESQELGIVMTDGRGIFVLNLALPADAPEDETRCLRLAIFDEEQPVAETEIEAQVPQREVAEVRVVVQEDERGVAEIGDVVPPALAARLRAKGIRTLRDVLDDPELVDEDDPEGLERLRGVARYAIMTDLGETQRDALLDAGLLSPLALADLSRAEFVREHHERLGGDAATYALHFATLAARRVLDNAIDTAGLYFHSGQGDPDVPELPPGVIDTLSEFKKCGCKDCDSAVSPAAYLAHLLSWTLKHLKDGSEALTLANLEGSKGLFQPFRNLPASCQAVEEQVRQVRICIEVLWRFMDWLELPDPELPSPFRTGYRQLRNQLYRTILTNLGVSHGQLRQAVLAVEEDNPVAETIAAQRQAIAERLGIAETHLPVLFFNIDLPPVSPSELELQERFGYRSTRLVDHFETPAEPLLITWQRERLATLWQEQDWSADAYSGAQRLPFVDPEIITESYLRTPLAENPAFTLLEARQAALTAQRQQMTALDPQQNGLADLVDEVLGTSIDMLRDLYATLQSPDATGEALAQAQEAVAELRLTPAGFSHLMEVDARLDAEQALGATDEDIDAAWEAVFDVLSRAHRHSLFPAWVGEEQAIGLILGPKQFWLPVEPASLPNPWQATVAERAAWEEALHRRSSRPLIDPDQIATSHIRGLSFQANLLQLPSTATFELWEDRRKWINLRIHKLVAARQGQPTATGALHATLEASTLGLGGRADLQALAELEAGGGDLEQRLEQISLTLPAYRLLAKVHLLAQADATISSDLWSQFTAILVQAEKRREFAEWRAEEQREGITLHPRRFRLPEPSPTVDDSPLTRWLHDPLALQQWEATLKARIAQIEALEEALAKAVGDAEGALLPVLRNLLITHSTAPGGSVEKKAAWLDTRLLVDMQMAGCHMTTRISQAIETLQRLVRGVYTGEHPQFLQHVTLDAEEDYEAGWPVFGSYPTWRAFMLAYLFPENLLPVTPAPVVSDGFAKLKRALVGHVQPDQACEAARVYSAYFRDICDLRLEATCQIATFLGGEACEPGATTAPSRIHLFARARESGRVYWLHFDPSLAPANTITTWIHLARMGEVSEISGATPHETLSGQRYILLFAVGRGGELRMRKFDVDRGSWLGVDTLNLPVGSEAGISACVIQKRFVSSGQTIRVPTIVAVSIIGGSSYISKLRDDANGWEPGGWQPLFGPTLARKIRQIRALLQITPNQDTGNKQYVVLATRDDGKVCFRSPSVTDSGILDDGYGWIETGAGQYAGAIARSESGITGPPFHGFLLFSGGQGTTFRAVSVSPVKFDTTSYTNVKDFNQDWLEPNIGVSLDDVELFQFVRFAPDYWVPLGFFDTKDSYRPLNPNFGSQGNFFYIRGHFTGSLLGLLTIQKDSQGKYPPGFEQFQLPHNAKFWDLAKNDLDLHFYLVQLKYYGLQKFLSFISDINNKTNLGPELRWWKFANDRVREFTKTELSLTDVLQRFLIREIRDIYSLWAEDLPTEVKVVVRQQDTTPKVSSSAKVGNAEWFFVPRSGEAGDDPAPNDPEVLVIEQSGGSDSRENGAYCLKATRIPGSFWVSSAQRLAPNPYLSGPMEVLPERSKSVLQERKYQIELMYEPHLGSPVAFRYLREAYNLVPMYIGHQLQRSGFYEEALQWYRLVYDHGQPSNKRKIDYSLIHEESLKWNYADVQEWLGDSNNPHTIAGTRRNTYTRHVLLMIIRCLVDYADVLFSHDNVSDNARARELYTLALKLLDSKELKPDKSTCDDILGELKIEVVEPLSLPLEQFKVVLAEIPDPDRLAGVVGALRAINQDTGRSLQDRVADMQEIMANALAEIPPSPRMNAVLETRRQTAKTLERQFLAHRATRTLLQKTQQGGRQVALTQLAYVTDTPVETLLAEPPTLEWLRQPRPNGDGEGTGNDRLDLAILDTNIPRRLAILNQIRNAKPRVVLSAIYSGNIAINSGLSFGFCIPQNPVVTALRRRAENNLLKLRTCRNIAGLLREIDPYGAPIGFGSGLVSVADPVFSGIVEAPPTPYRYSDLRNRAEKLVHIAQQIEASYQTAMEKAEAQTFSVLEAGQRVEMADARVRLADLHVTQSHSEMSLAKLQRDAAEFRQTMYASSYAQGIIFAENTLLEAYQSMIKTEKKINTIALTEKLITTMGDTIMAAFGMGSGPSRSTATDISALMAKDYGYIKSAAELQALQLQLSIEARRFELAMQQGIAAHDTLIGELQIQLAHGGIDIAHQERVIAGLEQEHAWDTLNFLNKMNFNAEMYQWMSAFLREVYRFFLQSATSIAFLAERQLGFERPEGAPKLIRSDYWNASVDDSTTIGQQRNRLGLTGSARLLKDLYQLDNYAYETRRRRQSLIFTLDLDQIFPVEFQHFRETGVLVFETPMSLIDRQMPGYYLCLIQQVSVSVVALISPTHGIRATLTSTGTSRVVVGGDTFQTVTIRNLPERIALTARTTTSGVMELGPEAHSLLRPFEGLGMDAVWELRLAKPANPFVDFKFIATVLFSLEVKALHSFDYERQVIERLDRRVSANRAFYFRQEFADAWYDLHNPDQTSTPMTVTFETRRGDFPPNLEQLRIEHVLLYFIGAGRDAEEVTVTNLSFSEDKSSGAVGGGAATVDGVISTRRGNGTSWLPMVGASPIGKWELALADTPEVRNMFDSEACEDILLVITYGGQLPKWP